MINDLVGEHPPLQPGDLSIAATLGTFTVRRLESELWAASGLKFLIFDDTSIKENGYDSDDDEEMMRIAIEMSTQSEDDYEQSSTATSSKGKEVVITDAPNSHEGNDSSQYTPCLVCSSKAEFPHNRKTRKFRLFSPKDEFPELFDPENDGRTVPPTDALCPHYVAVSYCWPPPETDSEGNVVETPRTYKVRDLDGKVRSNRAPDDVLDRAVDVANSVGLKMIWIDQECLPQPGEDSPEADKREHQLGVQAMDLVYNRAWVTAGIQELEICSQAQVDALRAFMTEHSERYSELSFLTLRSILPLVIEFLDGLSQSRWYTRAWVVQEAISAGERLAMVFRRGPGVTFSSQLRQVGDSYPGHSLDTITRALPSEVIIIPVKDFRRVVQCAKTLLQQTSFQHIGNTLYRSSFQHRPAAEIVAKAETLHPVLYRPSHTANVMQVVAGNRFGYQIVVDAAGALTLLKTRGCRYDEDRIAIMANMCGYEFRLDAKVVAAHCDSLRLAILTLAILNGDLSLLAPELYGTYNSIPRSLENIYSQSSRGVCQWLYPLDTEPSSIDSVIVRAFSIPGVFRPGKIEPRGVSLPAYIWHVGKEGKIDLTPAKVAWDEKWAKLNCLAIGIEPREKETQEAFAARHKAVSSHFMRPDIDGLVRLVLMDRRVISGDDDDSNDSPVWEGLADRRGVRVERILVADRVEGEREMQRVFCEIFFGILRFLMNQATEDPRTQGLADSIWQSVRVDQVDKEHPALPDSVTEALFNHPAVVTMPFRTLALDRDRRGSYHQAWLVDQVMMYGHLWTGRYVPSTQTVRADRPSSQPAPALGSREGGETVVSSAAAGPSSSSSSSRGGEQHQSLAASGASTTVYGVKRQRSILDRKLRDRFLGEMMRMVTFENYIKGTPEQREADQCENSWLSNSSMVAFAIVVGGERWTESAEDDRLQRLISVFDVDGPCTIAVPYVTGWEMLPHARPRSMSVCWVVEMVDDGDDRDVAKKEMMSDGSDEGDTDLKAQEGTYKVHGKVRGMWEVMDIPQQMYVFQ